MKACPTVSAEFDDPNLLLAAGLAPTLQVAGAAGSYELDQHLSVASAYAPGNSGCIVAGMLASGDRIDDLGLLRVGEMATLSGRVGAKRATLPPKQHGNAPL